MSKVTEFVKSTHGELKHVSWPTRQQTINSTALVIGLSVAVALFLSLFDWLFSLVLKLVVS